MEGAMVPFDQVERMSVAVAKSGLFGMTTPDQALALMLLCQAEGIHPMTAVRDYHIIKGRPSLKADAMLARFQQAGGVVKWVEHTDKKVSAYFSHPSCPDPVLIDWDMPRAVQAGVAGKDNWKNYPRQMLRARVISEGVRATYPGACSGVYTPEEVQDFTDDQNARPVIEPPKKIEKAQEAPKNTVGCVSTVAEAEIVPPTPLKVAKDQPKTEALATQSEPLTPAPEVKAPVKAQKTVKERLENAKKMLGDKEYKAYLKACDLTEAKVTEDNVSFVLRGMRVRYEEMQKVAK